VNTVLTYKYPSGGPFTLSTNCVVTGDIHNRAGAVVDREDEPDVRTHAGGEIGGRARSDDRLLRTRSLPSATSRPTGASGPNCGLGIENHSFLDVHALDLPQGMVRAVPPVAHVTATERPRRGGRHVRRRRVCSYYTGWPKEQAVLPSPQPVSTPGATGRRVCAVSRFEVLRYLSVEPYDGGGGRSKPEHGTRGIVVCHRARGVVRVHYASKWVWMSP
jgi:hypothetical protein